MISGADVAAVAAPLKKPTRGRLLIVAGAIATVVWLVLLAGYIFVRWKALTCLEPNAVGDFLAGAFAPLAFLWLVLGFFQQGIELRNSGDALWLQGEELRNSVLQQRELVAAARDQLAFEKDASVAQNVEMLRRAQPAFKVYYEGVMGGNSSEVVHSIRLANTGKDCFDLMCRIDAMGDAPLPQPTSFSQDVYATGTWTRLEVRWPNVADDDLVVKLSYRDSLNRDQEKRFSICRDGPDINIIEREQVLA